MNFKLSEESVLFKCRWFWKGGACSISGLVEFCLTMMDLLCELDSELEGQQVLQQDALCSNNGTRIFQTAVHHTRGFWLVCWLVDLFVFVISHVLISLHLSPTVGSDRCEERRESGQGGLFLAPVRVLLD